MREWIDVNDRLPETDDWVWVTIDSDGDRITTRAWYSHHYKIWCEFDNVIAWMSMEAMPEPYKE